METTSQRNEMRFDASADLYIRVESGMRYTHEEIKGFVERAASSVEPWRNTRGQPFENYLRPNYETGRAVQGQLDTLYLITITQLGRVSRATLGAQQLFAYRAFVESVVHAVAELGVPGLHSVDGVVNYSLPLARHTAPLST